MTRRFVVMGLLMLLATASETLAFQTEVRRYFDALARVCQTGITPEIVQRYEEAAKAVEAARYGGGRDNNFWGVKTPEKAYIECLQSPGAGFL